MFNYAVYTLKGNLMEESARIISVSLDNNSEISIVSKKKVSKRPNFIMAGNGTTNREGIMAVHVFREFVDMSKPAIRTFNLILDAITWENRTGEVKINMSDLESSQVQMFKKGFKELSEKGLVVRTKRSHYLINPNAIIPLDYEEALRIWNEAVSKSTKS